MRTLETDGGDPAPTDDVVSLTRDPAGPASESGGARHARLIGRYIILETLGEGGMGVVYAAYDPSLDRKVALKLLRPGGDDRKPGSGFRREQRLLAEAKALARLSHPNIVAIHDVGTNEGRVFLAMELLGAGTLRSWFEGRTRSRREVIEMFVRIGRGLAAAHATGVIHRDFKPDNVLLDGEGTPKIVDFGLAQVIAEEGGPVPDAATAGGLRLAIPGTATPTSALIGTPAYMAPEQFLGRSPDPAADQFAFCVSLYEALFHERPFAGGTVLEIAGAVVSGERRPMSPGVRLPRSLVGLLERGLAPAKAVRHASMQALVDRLEQHLRSPVRRRLAVPLMTAAILAVTASAGMYVRDKRRAFDRTVTGIVAGGAAALDEADQAIRGVEALRTTVVARRADEPPTDAELDDRDDRKIGELVAYTDERYGRALQAAESAMLLDPGRAEARELAGRALFGRLRADLEADREPNAEAWSRLALYDSGGQLRGRLTALGALTVEAAVAIPGARADIERFVRVPDGSGRFDLVEDERPLPIAGLALDRGSYRVTVRAPGRPEVRLPILLRAGARERLRAVLPRAQDLPADFVLVSAGELLVGSSIDGDLRRDLFHAPALHRMSGAHFLIKRHETTFAEWIAFLDALPPVERARRTPRAATIGTQGNLELRRLGDGRWRLRLQTTSAHATEAELGQPLRDPARTGFESQDWSKLPVSAVSAEDAAAYARWLRDTGRVPGARLCTNVEWEHAARGADGRPYPHGWRLFPGDANYNGTFHEDLRAYGPVMVGSFPRSDSPYGVSDMAGNLWEWVRASSAGSAVVLRGGGFAFNAVAQRSDARDQAEPAMRDITVGVRLCADFRE